MADASIFIGTLPHYEWGAAFRSGTQNLDQAIFVVRDGHRVVQRSTLCRPHELVSAMFAAGLKVVRDEVLRLPHSETRISPDIAAAARVIGGSAYDIPIVHLLVAAKE
jgi:hypothetical protein